MGKSPTEICNMALGRIAVSQTIANYELEQSTEARACRTFYENARDRVLEDFPWNFAKKQVELQLIQKTVEGWGYCYSYPNDCITARKLIFSGCSYDTKIPFEVVEDEANDGLAICTDISDAILVYTYRVKSSRLFPQSFVEALSWALAIDIAPVLTTSPDMARYAMSGYSNALTKAGAHSNNEECERPVPDADSIKARS